ncbi:hypothetical protein BC939DRAFT_460414 [Gamsiella multidivaricata]|uniref:uncharacterized protein n=1 Tax=Gamsiella multidivaricata TaxID=101098 RepID=UPI00221FE502|nr:uncharacterized protein BC939DRAFT_460414 [Gamsiella multidivaricata]KAI7819317.1 hypothetical protein BC939DRAFT_460414 [Gamsiella multidivaricata]
MCTSTLLVHLLLLLVQSGEQYDHIAQEKRSGVSSTIVEDRDHRGGASRRIEARVVFIFTVIEGFGIGCDGIQPCEERSKVKSWP